MKKLFALLLSVTMAMSMAACSNTAPPETTNAPNENQETISSTQPEKSAPEEAETPVDSTVTNSASYTELVFAEVESGPIVGFNYNGVNTFRGIPYATAKRFQAPEKVEPWTDVRPCFNWGNVAHALQNEPTEVPFSEFMTPSDNHWVVGEDCQNLNIWSPSMNADDKLPVLVFFHGGNGNAQELVYYDGHNLADSGDLVFVTMNHREELLGRMDLSAYGEEYKNSAFCEYLDFIAGLEWIRDNISNFGGDPGNVTIMGQSAGAGNVMDIMGMPAADGLYHKAVISSGPSIDPHLTTTSEETRAEGAAFIEKLGLTAETIGQIDDIPYETLLNAAVELGLNYTYGAMPCDTGFLVDVPFAADGELESTRSIPLMLDGAYSEYSDNFAGQVLGYGYDEYHYPEVSAEKVRELLEAQYGENTDKVLELYEAAYPGRDPFWALYITTGRGGDFYDVADLRIANGGAPVYTAVYSYCYPLFGGVAPVHTDGTIPLAFNNIGLIPEQIAGDEETAFKVASEASTALANFCRNGDPNGEGVPNWPAFEGEQGTTMFFDRTSEARSGYAERDLLRFMQENRVQQ